MDDIQKVQVASPAITQERFGRSPIISMPSTNASMLTHTTAHEL
jgi:hypothetical protein